MSKDKISDYSSTANSNTDIAGINIDEGCAPSGINDAIRTLMAQLKTWQSGGQDVYIHPAGSASAPSITANGDTNTGIFFPAADTIAFAEGGAEIARFDSSGNLGLGVTPSTYSIGKVVEVGFAGNSFWGYAANTNLVTQNVNLASGALRYSSTNPASFYQQSSGVHTWGVAPSGTAGNAITFTQAMTLNASGNLGVGLTDPSAYGSSVRLQLYRTSFPELCFADDATPSATAAPRISGGNAEMRFSTNGSERARIDSSGRLLVGKTSAGDTVLGTQIGGDGYITATRSDSTNANTTYHVYSTAAGAYRFYVGMAGTVFATSTTISAISDIRFKENVRDLNVGLAEVMALKPRLYDWKEGKGADIKNARGFIAQEFEEVFPDLIDEWKEAPPEGEEPYKSVRADLIPVLVKASQELKAIVDAQAVEIAALKG